MSYLKEYSLLGGIIVFGAIIRFLFLDRIPPALGGDELQYVLNARAFALSGYDLSGQVSLFSPLLFRYPLGILPQAELPYYLLLPFVTNKLGLLSTRLPSYLLGIFFIPIMYGVGKELGGKRVGLLASFVAVSNPWLFFISHTAYESTAAVVFYFLGLVILLKTKSKARILSLPIFFLAFYAYIGTKIILIPFILVVVLFLFVRQKTLFMKDRISLAGVVVFGFVLSLFFFMLQQQQSRLGEIQTPFSPEITQRVNTIRQVTIANPLLSLTENRFTIYTKIIADKLLTIFSTQYLFVSGDNFFGIWRHGLFYLLDSFLLIAGFIVLLLKNKSTLCFLLGLLIVGALPQLLHKQEENFTPHITMMIPPFLLIIAFGIEGIWERIKQLPQSKFIFAGGVLLYFLSVGYFLHMYFFQYPLQGEFDLPSRTLSYYAKIASDKGHNIYIFSQRPSDIYKKYLFYGNLVTISTLSQIRISLSHQEFTIGNVFFRECGDKAKTRNDVTVVVDKLCKDPTDRREFIAISNLRDWGEEYVIYQDRVCEGNVDEAMTPVTLDDFHIENLSVERFCQTFLRRVR